MKKNLKNSPWGCL